MIFITNSSRQIRFNSKIEFHIVINILPVLRYINISPTYIIQVLIIINLYITINIIKNTNNTHNYIPSKTSAVISVVLIYQFMQHQFLQHQFAYYEFILYQ